MPSPKLVPVISGGGTKTFTYTRSWAVTNQVAGTPSVSSPTLNFTFMQAWTLRTLTMGGLITYAGGSYDVFRLILAQLTGPANINSQLPNIQADTGSPAFDPTRHYFQWSPPEIPFSDMRLSLPAGAYQFNSDAILRSPVAALADVITIRLYMAFDISV